MMKTASLLAILVFCATAAAAQSTEVGVLFGGSKRVSDRDEPASGATLIDEGFTLSNSSFDFYYGIELDPGTLFKVRIGRIEGPIGFREIEIRGPEEVEVRRDVEGEVQHAEAVVEYRFSEPFGSAGIYAGVGAYRHSAAGFGSTTDYGFPVGITADFPLTRRYGVILDAAYHFTKHDFNPRYLTIGAGLRFAY